MNFKEKEIINIVRPYLSKCKPGDFNHSLRVVKWVKILGKGRDDLELIIVAAYLHDIGRYNLLSENRIDYNKMIIIESKANKNTEKYVKEVLGKLNATKKEVDKIIRLVKSAHKHKSEGEDEEIIVDSDNLSKLCFEHLKEKYLSENYIKIIDDWEDEFPNRIKTKIGKEIYSDLLSDLKKNITKI